MVQPQQPDNHLFCHAEAHLVLQCFSNVASALLAWLHGARVPCHPCIAPEYMSLLSIPLESCRPGCWDAQSMHSFPQIMILAWFSVMLPLFSTGSSRPTWTKGRPWCLRTQGRKGEPLCPASRGRRDAGPLYCKRERWQLTHH